jgi:predicted DNA-binding protein with PD1-like motif
LSALEAMGCGTLAYDAEHDEVLPHIHTTVGDKARSAAGYTSHLLSAKVQFLTEMLVVEVTSPSMTRPPNADLFDVPLLTFGEDSLPGRRF